MLSRQYFEEGIQGLYKGLHAGHTINFAQCNPVCYLRVHEGYSFCCEKNSSYSSMAQRECFGWSSPAIDSWWNFKTSSPQPYLSVPSDKEQADAEGSKGRL